MKKKSPESYFQEPKPVLLAEILFRSGGFATRELVSVVADAVTASVRSRLEIELRDALVKQQQGLVRLRLEKCGNCFLLSVDSAVADAVSP